VRRLGVVHGGILGRGDEDRSIWILLLRLQTRRQLRVLKFWSLWISCVAWGISCADYVPVDELKVLGSSANDFEGLGLCLR
jgi:hypothetical protein